MKNQVEMIKIFNENKDFVKDILNKDLLMPNLL